MSSIPKATPIVLTGEERAELERLARSSKTEYRLRQRARIIDLAGRKTWCVSQDPEFAAKAAEIVGLYLKPPDGALVLAVDEKPHIQALERVQGYLKLPNGRAVSGQAHDYKRHGTSTLFAALNIANGEVTARHYQRRRRIEFLDFMNAVLAV